MAFDTNRFCWHGCVSTDVEAAKEFYSNVIGWQVNSVPMGDMDATLFSVGDKFFAHVSPPSIEGTPSHWSSFLRVDDVDASTKKSVENGGTELLAPNDIPPGRFSVVSTPSGASMALFHEADPDDSYHHDTAPGLVHWVELQSTNASADLAWLKSTFGFTTDEMPMPTGQYHILKRGDEPSGGVMALDNNDMPANWMVWINVADVDETMSKAQKHAGEVIAPVFAIPEVGRMGVIKDPAGGVLGVITPEG